MANSQSKENANGQQPTANSQCKKNVQRKKSANGQQPTAKVKRMSKANRP